MTRFMLFLSVAAPRHISSPMKKTKRDLTMSKIWSVATTFKFFFVVVEKWLVFCNQDDSLNQCFRFGGVCVCLEIPKVGTREGEPPPLEEVQVGFGIRNRPTYCVMTDAGVEKQVQGVEHLMRNRQVTGTASAQGYTKTYEH